MAIEYKKNQALFRDVVSVEEAEGLLEWLQKKPSAKVDFSACAHLHPANLQVEGVGAQIKGREGLEFVHGIAKNGPCTPPT